MSYVGFRKAGIQLNTFDKNLKLSKYLSPLS